MSGWIGVDLDGTLAKYYGWDGPDSFGEPVPAMMDRVKGWLADGIEVRIFTARASIPEQIPPIEAWLERHGIGGLKVTCKKDFAMVQLWDDRCVQVKPNTGRSEVKLLEIENEKLRKTLERVQNAVRGIRDINDKSMVCSALLVDFDPKVNGLEILYGEKLLESMKG